MSKTIIIVVIAKCSILFGLTQVLKLNYFSKYKRKCITHLIICYFLQKNKIHIDVFEH